ncbi:MAG: BREX-1 system adenine-specific DNA-methyltransferase PglX [Adlercreutzia sp.]|uniref:BREX-1 system adenine-specific DNA-methyltransferase PglX n=1 Tax=uncultured Adlercreutzia sp. TaxID=875803 RepID=UPI002172A01B|nr:BREX-1 system adenine-specific DNA-methyltransferase PglX [uncultured Adlercreutzia sp.]MCI8424992.1 BREX-1 system adenine-specific DNA-methyltransferase PglX [Adlercreutzia sp.]
MNDTAIKNFCIWARRDLMEQVRIQAARFGIREDGYDPASADAIEGRLLTAQEKRQRADLIRRLGPDTAPGYGDAYGKLIDQATYTWFNRLVAIRFMELNDRLPSHVRVLSAEDGTFRPQILREALAVEIEGLSAGEVADLVAASDDEALFRCLFLAQCRELAACLPDVFEPVGAAMELLLPEHLLRAGSVVDRLVTDIPEDDWRQGVEIVGWMYQYYVSERKDEVFASFKKGKKAEADAIAPATQLFTPDWIVQYLTQNSLGRLWLQSHPESQLATQMPYYIPDDLGAEEAPGTDISVGQGPCPCRSTEAASRPVTPESLRVIDPACGSGHILVYAFRLLAVMYEEAGHPRRDIPRLILANNLTGLEIDPRAAAMASFALSMEACELDRRYLRREERANPRIICLKPAEIAEEELEYLPMLAARSKLLDAMAHMGECGSLFVPEPADLEALRVAENELDARAAGGDLLAAGPLKQVSSMIANCEPLAETYDCVIANPPYMGSSNMDKWLAAWTKKHYPDSKRDLCTCFIERGFTLTKPDGFISMITASSWMFISSFEAFREKLLERGSIISMVQQSTHGYAGVTVPTCIFSYQIGDPDIVGSYIRLEEFDRPQLQEPKTAEAIANPTCGWFYRRHAKTFKSIPGTPIAYWAGDAMIGSFLHESLDSFARQGSRVCTGDNARFIREWFEVNGTNQDVWVPYPKGGDFRKWYGNTNLVLDWRDNGSALKSFVGAQLGNMSYLFQPGITWSAISSSRISFRVVPSGMICDQKGPLMLVNDRTSEKYFLGLMNSVIADSILRCIAPTISFTWGDIARVPIVVDECSIPEVCLRVQSCILVSQIDWDSLEISRDFAHHPLV